MVHFKVPQVLGFSRVIQPIDVDFISMLLMGMGDGSGGWWNERMRVEG